MLPSWKIEQAGLNELTAISTLARTIWKQHYPAIIGDAQVDYMLGRMYAQETMRNEILSQGIVYDMAIANGEILGFSSYGPHPDGGSTACMKLQKLYVSRLMRRHGIGRSLMLRAVEWGLSSGYQELVLSVNKQNHAAVLAYRNLGLRELEQVVVDIGGGFVMDDYVMGANLVDLITRLRVSDGSV